MGAEIDQVYPTRLYIFFLPKVKKVTVENGMEDMEIETLLDLVTATVSHSGNTYVGKAQV